MFAARQAEHRAEIKIKLEQAHRTIVTALGELYEHFRSDPGEVQREWRRFVASTDKMLGDALRQTVKRSLQELSKAINGDAKTEPQALFKVHTVLESASVGFRPTMINLTQTVNMVSKDLINSIAIASSLL